jgi:hypothetical protein
MHSAAAARATGRDFLCAISVVGGSLIPKVGMPATSTSIRTFMAAAQRSPRMPREDASRPSVSSESRVMHLASTPKR